MEEDVESAERSEKPFKESSLPIEDSRDLISCLSDSLLLHILSFLEMQDVIKTSLLSRRWRYLWTSIPCMNFTEFSQYPTRIDLVNFIDRSIFHHEGSNVRKFHIIYPYKHTDALQVDSWIRFAIRRDVEELELDFLYGKFQNKEHWHDTLYNLPHSLFNCGSLTTLTLKSCDLNLPASIRLSSLKTLYLEDLNLSRDTIKHFTSGCPLLEDLTLFDCNRFTNLNISFANSHLKTLKILEFSVCDSDTNISIYAPNLLSLEFINGMPRAKYRVKKLPSLSNASFIEVDEYEDKLHGKDDGFNLARLLSDLDHVKDLRLSSWCIQVLSIREVQRLDSLPLNATCLELVTGLTKWELPGIAHLLKRSFNLEKLTITINERQKIIQLDSDFEDNYDFEEDEYWNSQGLDLSSLKTITIYGFMSKSREHESSEVEEFLEELKNEIELVRFLLKNSKVLERMIIKTSKKGESVCNNFEILFKLTQKLIVFPRASPDAGIFID